MERLNLVAFVLDPLLIVFSSDLYAVKGPFATPQHDKRFPPANPQVGIILNASVPDPSRDPAPLAPSQPLFGVPR